MPTFLLLPLFAALIYAVGSILLKRGLRAGLSADQSFHLTNWMMGLLFLPLIFFERETIAWEAIWRPLVMGLTFFVATWLTFLGLKRGDVSLVTPLMGTKVVFVALAVVVIQGQVPSTQIWFAAGLTAAGILLMGWSDIRKGKHIWPAVLLTLASAATFGLCDVLVNTWAQKFAPLTFLAIGSGTVAVLSGLMWMVQGRQRIPKSTDVLRWALPGAVCIALQAILMGLALGFFEGATSVNIVYASRGLWTLILIVLVGSILGIAEHRESGAGFLWRIAGTILLTTAIVLAVLESSG